MLAGAAVHALTDKDDPQGTRDRVLTAFAVELAFQGKALSDGRWASAAVLETVVSDIVSRHDQSERIILNALVDPANQASNTCLSRFGIKPRGRTESGANIIHAALIN